ncbi:unnamed protein product [Cochlearia groenlandica]
MVSSTIAPTQAGFASLRLGRATQTVVGRLLRHWDSKNIKKCSIGKPATLCCNGRAPPVARTRVEVLVDDGTNYATIAIAAKGILALADGISNMTTDEVDLRYLDQQINRKKTNSATALLPICQVNIGGEGGLARAVRQLQGRRFVIHVIKANTFSSRTCPFIVLGITDYARDEPHNNVSDPCAAVDSRGPKENH